MLGIRSIIKQSLTSLKLRRKKLVNEYHMSSLTISPITSFFNRMDSRHIRRQLYWAIRCYSFEYVFFCFLILIWIIAGEENLIELYEDEMERNVEILGATAIEGIIHIFYVLPAPIPCMTSHLSNELFR
jgi:hypothetical protein